MLTGSTVCGRIDRQDEVDLMLTAVWARANARGALIILAFLLAGVLSVGIAFVMVEGRSKDSTVCDDAVHQLLTTKDLVELERSKFLIRWLDCGVRPPAAVMPSELTVIGSQAILLLGVLIFLLTRLLKWKRRDDHIAGDIQDLRLDLAEEFRAQRAEVADHIAALRRLSQKH
jgi:hypothetical protein